MTDKMICEKCGTEMVDKSSGASIFVECPKCGWGWATTAYDSSNDDDTCYEIWLIPNNPQNIDVIKVVAEIASVNFLQAKKLLSADTPILIYKAHHESVSVMNTVQRIQSIAKRLADTDVQFLIKPDFPYEY